MNLKVVCVFNLVKNLIIDACNQSMNAHVDVRIVVIFVKLYLHTSQRRATHTQTVFIDFDLVHWRNCEVLNDLHDSSDKLVST